MRAYKLRYLLRVLALRLFTVEIEVEAVVTATAVRAAEVEGMYLALGDTLSFEWGAPYRQSVRVPRFAGLFRRRVVETHVHLP